MRDPSVASGAAPVAILDYVIGVDSAIGVDNVIGVDVIIRVLLEPPVLVDNRIDLGLNIVPRIGASAPLPSENGTRN